MIIHVFKSGNDFRALHNLQWPSLILTNLKILATTQKPRLSLKWPTSWLLGYVKPTDLYLLALCTLIFTLKKTKISYFLIHFCLTRIFIFSHHETNIAALVVCILTILILNQVVFEHLCAKFPNKKPEILQKAIWHCKLYTKEENN